MPKLKTIAATFAAALAAMGLSVGAALAEGEQAAQAHAKPGQQPPSGVCIFHKLL